MGGDLLRHPAPDRARAATTCSSRVIRVPRWRRALIALRAVAGEPASAPLRPFRPQVDSRMDSRPAPTSMASEADVVVIGGGVAGLSAATALAERGARVLVLEARPRSAAARRRSPIPATGEPRRQRAARPVRLLRRDVRASCAASAPRPACAMQSEPVDRQSSIAAGRRSRLACPAAAGAAAPARRTAGAGRRLAGATGCRPRCALAPRRRRRRVRSETVRAWLARHRPDAAAHRAAVGAAGRCRAEPADRRRRRGTVRASDRPHARAAARALVAGAAADAARRAVRHAGARVSSRRAAGPVRTQARRG